MVWNGLWIHLRGNDRWVFQFDLNVVCNVKEPDVATPAAWRCAVHDAFTDRRSYLDKFSCCDWTLTFTQSRYRTELTYWERNIFVWKSHKEFWILDQHTDMTPCLIRDNEIKHLHHKRFSSFFGLSLSTSLSNSLRVQIEKSMMCIFRRFIIF